MIRGEARYFCLQRLDRPIWVCWQISGRRETQTFMTLLDTAATAKSLQLCPTLCDPIDSSPPGSAVPEILQARTLEWVTISFSIAWKWKVKVKSLSRVRHVATPWTAAYQAPPSMGFSRQEYWSGYRCPIHHSTSSMRGRDIRILLLSTGRAHSGTGNLMWLYEWGIWTNSMYCCCWFSSWHY